MIKRETRTYFTRVQRMTSVLWVIVLGFCSVSSVLCAVLTVPTFEISDSALTLELGGTFTPESVPFAGGRSIYLYANGGATTDWVPSTQFYSPLTTPDVTSGSLTVGTRTFPGQLSIVDGHSGVSGDYVEVSFTGGILSSGSAASGMASITLPANSFANTDGLEFSLYWGTDASVSYQSGGKLTDISAVPEPRACGFVAVLGLLGFVLKRRYLRS